MTREKVSPEPQDDEAGAYVEYEGPAGEIIAQRTMTDGERDELRDWLNRQDRGDGDIDPRKDPNFWDDPMNY